MQSFIIYGADLENRLGKARDLCLEKNISQFDIALISTNDEDEKSTTIGINAVKALQQKLFLKPLKGEMKACIITEAEKLTLPAQNALLKALEEPPINTLIFLLIQNASTLLPTIRSRCSEINISEKEVLLSAQEMIDIYKEWLQLKKAPLGEKLKNAQDFAKEKSDSAAKLEKFIIILADKLNESIKRDGAETLEITNEIKLIQSAHTVLTTTNTNPRLIFEHLFLSLSPSSNS